MKYLSVFIVLLFFAMVSCGVLLSSCATIPRDDSISAAYLNSGYDHTHRRRYKSYKDQMKLWYKNQTEASRNSPYYGVGQFIHTLTLNKLRKEADEEDDRNRAIAARKKYEATDETSLRRRQMRENLEKSGVSPEKKEAAFKMIDAGELDNWEEIVERDRKREEAIRRMEKVKDDVVTPLKKAKFKEAVEKGELDEQLKSMDI